MTNNDLITKQELPSLSEATVEKLKYLKNVNTSEFYRYVLSLRNNKWPLRAIAKPLNVSRSIVSVWERKATTDNLPIVEQLPPTLPREMRSVYSKHVLTIEQSNELRLLAKEASKVRRFTAENSPSRQAAAKLEKLLKSYKEQGASLSQLATACEVTRRAIAQRLEKDDK